MTSAVLEGPLTRSRSLRTKRLNALMKAPSQIRLRRFAREWPDFGRRRLQMREGLASTGVAEVAFLVLSCPRQSGG